LPPELLLLAQICTKSFVGWGFALDTTGDLTVQRSPRPPNWFRGRVPGEREGGRGGEKEAGRGGKGMGVSPGMPKSRVGKPNYNMRCSSAVRLGLGLNFISGPVT